VGTPHRGRLELIPQQRWMIRTSLRYRAVNRVVSLDSKSIEASILKQSGVASFSVVLTLRVSLKKCHLLDARNG